MPCRSGCQTRDHGSWGECARESVRFARQWSAEVKKGNAWDAELAEYRSARSQGIQPASTQTRDIRAAVRLSEVADAPFNAEIGGFG